MAREANTPTGLHLLLLFPTPCALPFLFSFLVQTNSDRLTDSAVPGLLPIPASVPPKHSRTQGEYLRHPELRELLDVIFCQVLKRRRGQVTTLRRRLGAGEEREAPTGREPWGLW